MEWLQKVNYCPNPVLGGSLKKSEGVVAGARCCMPFNLQHYTLKSLSKLLLPQSSYQIVVEISDNIIADQTIG